jgi:hypothetical protein
MVNAEVEERERWKMTLQAKRSPLSSISLTTYLRYLITKDKTEK